MLADPGLRWDGGISLVLVLNQDLVRVLVGCAHDFEMHGVEASFGLFSFKLICEPLLTCKTFGTALGKKPVRAHDILSGDKL